HAERMVHVLIIDRFLSNVNWLVPGPTSTTSMVNQRLRFRHASQPERDSMARPRMKVQVACRDCAMCTGRAFTGLGRSIGRGTANAATFGIAALARRMCKACDHPMSEHVGQDAQAVIAAQAVQTPPNSSSGAQTNESSARWVQQLDGVYRWWNGENWTDFRTNYPSDPGAIEKAKSALTDYP